MRGAKGLVSILPEMMGHLSLSPVFGGVRVTRSLVFCVCFVGRCLPLCFTKFREQKWKFPLIHKMAVHVAIHLKHDYRYTYHSIFFLKEYFCFTIQCSR
jgi:hypothetical protein